MNYIKNNAIFFTSILLAIGFWFFESLLHAYHFDQEIAFEVIPHDSNEMWMRLVIFLMIPFIGFLAGKQVKLEKKIQEEKMRTLQASMVSMNEMVGNTLSLMNHYCDDFIKKGEVDIDSVESMKEIIQETFEGLKHLSELENMIIREQYQESVRRH